MSEYNAYVTAVNKIFDYLEKMKIGWNSLDNKNYIESIEEYKQIVIRNAELIKNTPITKMDENTIRAKVEELGDD